LHQFPSLERYQTVAADYLHLAIDDPAAGWYAQQAQKVADQAAYDYLRALGQRGPEGGETPEPHHKDGSIHALAKAFRLLIGG
jgi:hypothetical protein